MSVCVCCKCVQGTRDELLRWNNHCRSRTAVVSVRKGEVEVGPKPIKFIAAGAPSSSSSSVCVRVYT